MILPKLTTWMDRAVERLIQRKEAIEGEASQHSKDLSEIESEENSSVEKADHASRHAERYGFDKANLLISAVGLAAYFGHSDEVRLIDISETGLSFESGMSAKVGKLLHARIAVEGIPLGDAIIIVRNCVEQGEGSFHVGCEIDWMKTQSISSRINPKKLLRLRYMAKSFQRAS